MTINYCYTKIRSNYIVSEEAKRLMLIEKPQACIRWDAQYLAHHTYLYDISYSKREWLVRRMEDDECNAIFPLIGLDGIFDNVNVETCSSTFTIYPYSSIPMHVDNRRTINVNFLIEGDNKSLTNFYKLPDFNKTNSLGIPNIPDFIQYVRNNPGYRDKAEVVDRYTLDRGDVILLNSQVPHDVISYSDKTRIIFTAGFTPVVKTQENIDKLYYQLIERLNSL